MGVAARYELTIHECDHDQLIAIVENVEQARRLLDTRYPYLSDWQPCERCEDCGALFATTPKAMTALLTPVQRPNAGE